MTKLFGPALLSLIFGWVAFASAAEVPDGVSVASVNRVGIMRDSKAVAFGHNESATSYVLPDGECTAGLQIVACGTSHDLMYGISPWLLADYRMANFFTRFKIEESSEHQTSLQFAYFKTYHNERTTTTYDDFGNPTFRAGYLDYHMEAAWLQWVRSYQMNDHSVHHLNVAVQHYFDDLRPFSLRRLSMHDHNTQVNVSDLVEVQVSGPFFLMGEVGLLDLFGRYRHLHAGTSIQWREKSWMAHLGFSINGTYQALFTGERIDSQRRVMETYRTYDDDLPPEFYSRDYGLHPEFSAQYYF